VVVEKNILMANQIMMDNIDEQVKIQLSHSCLNMRRQK